ncbi:MAG: FIST N-terminal domain-containing protein [Negativicutes bacterium]|jgi:diguanylate cyclase (GGDEF)-like protein
MKTINTFYEDYSGLNKFVKKNKEVLFNQNRSAVLAQIFSGRCDNAFLANLAEEINQLVPQACIIGTTTSGEIMNGQVSGLRTVISFSVFQHSSITAEILPKNGDDFELGRVLASKLGSDRAKLLILFAAGLAVNTKDMLQGVQSVYPSLPVAGGIAGSNSLTEQSFVMCNGQVIDSGVAGVVLEGEELTVNCRSHLGWQPIGKEMTITKVDGLRVYTIDNMPAYDVYRKYLGLDERNFANVIEYPLITERQGIPTARTPITYFADGSIQFAAELLEGDKVRLSYGHVGTISEAIAGLCKEIKQKPVESIYVYSCECRRGFLQELSKIETEPLQEIAPTAGFFTLGEFFHAGSTNQLLNATMTVVALSERGGRIIKPTAKKIGEVPKSHQDNVAGRGTGVLKALTHLVNTVTAEPVSANAKLQYISLHDSLTGLYNRTFFEQEVKRLSSLDTPVGVIMCDLAFLKMLNDVFGHSAGDKALKSAAGIITKVCPEDAVAARIGGDEFAILVNNAELTMVEDISNQILAEAAEARRLDPESLLYLSIGFAFKGHNAIKSIAEAISVADTNMYRHKRADKKKVWQEIRQNHPGA